jgi:hypothetical protein
MMGADRVRVLNGNTKYNLRFIVNAIHAAEPARTIVADIWRRLPAAERGFAKRAIRHAAMRYACLLHARNGRNYRTLMSGNVGEWR